MGDYDNINWREHNFRNMQKPKIKKEPKIDTEVSRIVGRKVLATDPKLIKLAVRWRGNKPLDAGVKPDNHLQNPDKIKELKQTFG